MQLNILKRYIYMQPTWSNYGESIFKQVSLYIVFVINYHLCAALDLTTTSPCLMQIKKKKLNKDIFIKQASNTNLSYFDKMRQDFSSRLERFGRQNLFLYPKINLKTITQRSNIHVHDKNEIILFTTFYISQPKSTHNLS